MKAQKEKYFDARHVVHAFVIGNNAEILGCSDDGEPGGTAGRPSLDVLKGSGITNCLLTITRYFGGILLGTGGLVRAYSDAAKSVLSICTSEPIVEKKSFELSCGYDLYEQIKKVCLKHGASDLNENFQTDVLISGNIPVSEFENFQRNIKEISCGKVLVQ